MVPAVHTTGLINPNTDSDVAQDFALIYLDPKALDAQLTTAKTSGTKTWATILGSRIERPSLVVPSNTNTNGWFQFTSPISFAGWANYDQRQVASTSVQFQLITATTGAYWRLSTPSPGIGGGDSGGPLFTIRTDGSRDPFGVVSGGEYDIYKNEGDFVDLTNTTALNWLTTHARDVSSNHSTTWNNKHPPPSGHTDRWFGETDYVGTCQTGDSDCDGWFDAHDNCPNVYNPSQADSDDDARRRRYAARAIAPLGRTVINSRIIISIFDPTRSTRGITRVMVLGEGYFCGGRFGTRGRCQGCARRAIL